MAKAKLTPLEEKYLRANLPGLPGPVAVCRCVSRPGCETFGGYDPELRQSRCMKCGHLSARRQ